MNQRIKELIGILGVAIFLGCLIYFKLDAFLKMPGDLGDARLNNYFLENFYRFFSGKSSSLWHLEFFYPYPYVLGFSDNLFGSGIFYSLFRWANFESDTAFQLWFLLGYLGNFIAAYYGLRLLNLPPVPALIGALVFSFSIPTSNHAMHAQLHYRIGAALSIAYATKFWESHRINYFGYSMLWLVYQFYCGIYIGFFTLLFLSAMCCVFMVKEKPNYLQLRSINLKFFSLVVVLSILALLLLFYPYIKAKNIYQLSRGWSEISLMIPRIQSYFLADNLPIWNELIKYLPSVPLRWEHQMFIGIIPLTLLIWTLFINKKQLFSKTYAHLLWATLIVILMSLSIGGYSIWYFFHKLPLFSAMRAVTRLDQVLLFPIAYFIAAGLGRLNITRPTLVIFCGFFIGLLILSEWFYMPYASTSNKSEWRERIHALEKKLPTDIAPDKILFIAQVNPPNFASELDVMWLASKLEVNTLNGYSGNMPAGFSLDYGTNCREINNRLEAYQKFQKDRQGLPSSEMVRDRLIFIGFSGNCSEKSK